MKVLFINENIGGHATVHHHLRNAVAAREDITATFLDIPPPSVPARVVGASVPGLDRLDLDLQPLRAQLARSAWLARRVDPHLDGVDVIHLYTHNAGLLGCRTWRAHPTVVTLDTTNAQNAFRLPTRRPTRFTPLTVAATKPFERRVYRAATTVVANSRWAAESLRTHYGLGDDKLVVQPFGIGVPDLDCQTAPGGQGRSRPRAVFVGRSLLRKGGRQLLRVHEQHLSSRLDLTMVTTEPVDGGRGVTVIDDMRPGDERLWPLLQSCAMFVFPSEIDMAPNAVLEAMMAGLPVIARPVGAIPEMVEHGVTGLLVGPRDEDLTAAITELIDNPDRGRAMGRAGRQRALQHYDAGRTTAALVQILASTIDGWRRAVSTA